MGFATLCRVFRRQNLHRRRRPIPAGEPCPNHSTTTTAQTGWREKSTVFDLLLSPQAPPLQYSTESSSCISKLAHFSFESQLILPVFMTRTSHSSPYTQRSDSSFRMRAYPQQSKGSETQQPSTVVGSSCTEYKSITRTCDNELFSTRVQHDTHFKPQEPRLPLPTLRQPWSGAQKFCFSSGAKTGVPYHTKT